MKTFKYPVILAVIFFLTFFAPRSPVVLAQELKTDNAISENTGLPATPSGIMSSDSNLSLKTGSIFIKELFLPESPVYFFVGLYEKIRLFLATNPGEKLSLEIKFADNRLKEAKTEVSKGNVGQTEKSLAEYEFFISSKKNLPEVAAAADKNKLFYLEILKDELKLNLSENQKALIETKVEKFESTNADSIGLSPAPSEYKIDPSLPILEIKGTITRLLPEGIEISSFGKKLNFGLDAATKITRNAGPASTMELFNKQSVTVYYQHQTDGSDYSARINIDGTGPLSSVSGEIVPTGLQESSPADISN